MIGKNHQDFKLIVKTELFFTRSDRPKPIDTDSSHVVIVGKPVGRHICRVVPLADRPFGYGWMVKGLLSIRTRKKM